jgi:hypothetical protein
MVGHRIRAEARERVLQIGREERLAGAAVLDGRPEPTSIRLRCQSLVPPPKRLSTPASSTAIGMPIILQPPSMGDGKPTAGVFPAAELR